MKNKFVISLILIGIFLLIMCIFTNNVKSETVSFDIKHETTEFKNLFKDYISWNLEYKRYVSSEWTNGNQYLTINKLFNDTKQSYKFTLTLNVPVNIYSARFTFLCNRTVLDYINKTNYDVWLHYNIDGITHTVSFNFSDMINIQGLIFTKGILNNNFWFKFQKNNINSGTYIFDPSFSIVSTGRSVYKQDSSWTTARNSGTGTVYNSWLESDGDISGGNYLIYRGYYVFDTSSIPDDVTILTASLYVNYNYFGANPCRLYYQDSNSGSTVDTNDYNRNQFGDYYGSFYATGIGIYNNSLIISSINTTSYTTIVLRTDTDYNNTTPINAHAIATNGFTTVKLWVTYTNTPPHVTITNINSTSYYTTFWNNTGLYWFVNVTSTGSPYTCYVYDSNLTNITGYYDVTLNIDEQSYFVILNYKGNLTPLYLINITNNVTGNHTYIKNNSGYFVTAKYNGSSFDGNSSDNWLYVSDLTVNTNQFLLMFCVGLWLLFLFKYIDVRKENKNMDENRGLLIIQFCLSLPTSVLIGTTSFIMGMVLGYIFVFVCPIISAYYLYDFFVDKK